MITAFDPNPIRFLLATHLEPTHAAGNYFWIAAILKQAQASGFGTLLTGQGGNATISWTGLPEIPSYQSIFRKYSNNEIQLKSAIRQIIRHLVPETFVNLYRKLHAGKDPWKNYSAIDLDYAQKIDLNGLMKNGGHDPLFRQLKGSRQVRFAIIKPGVSQVGSRWQSDGSDYGIEVRDPTSDKDVMELCISIPDNYYRSGNIDRFLLRKSMEDFLPPSVLLNFTRGQQASDLVWRIRDNYNELDQLLKKVSRSEKANSITDIPQMRKILMDTQTLVNREILGETVTTLLRGMAVALFIDQNTH